MPSLKIVGAAFVRSRQQLVPDREGFGDHGGEACVDFVSIEAKLRRAGKGNKNGLVFLSPTRRKRDIGAAASRGDRM